MAVSFEPLSEAHRAQVIDIFNYYIENGFAAYPEQPVPYGFFDFFVTMTKGYPSFAVIGENGTVEGFGFLRPYNPLPAFRRTAELSYFLRQEHTGRGVGRELLRRLEDGARAMGITSLLAGISSLNEQSLAFHGKQGFVQCGRFEGVGVKRDTVFDVVWVQKKL